MPDRMPEDLPDRMPEDMPEDMPDRMPNRMSEDMSDRMPEDVPVRTCINVMVGITRSKVIWWHVKVSDMDFVFFSGNYMFPGLDGWQNIVKNNSDWVMRVMWPCEDDVKTFVTLEVARQTLKGNLFFKRNRWSHFLQGVYPLVNCPITMGKSPFLMGKSTINLHFQ